MTDTLAAGTGVDVCLWVYALVAREHPVGDAIDGWHLVRCGPVTAVCATVDANELAAWSDDASRLADMARRHDEVVRGLAAGGAVLPVRLGTLCADGPRLARAIRDVTNELVAQLDELRDCSEWTVRISLPDAAEPGRATEPSGVAYLAGRQAAYRAEKRNLDATRTTAARLRGELTALSRRSRVRSEVSASRMFSASFLVAGADRPAFWRAVDRAAVDLPSGHAQIQVTGPLPPYSFVDVRLEVTG